jgi:hypothetical protein
MDGMPCRGPEDCLNTVCFQGICRRADRLSLSPEDPAEERLPEEKIPEDASEGTKTACEEGEIRLCYTGMQYTRLIEPCQHGQQLCRQGVFGDCEGQITPRFDIPNNGIDEDCDGRIDQPTAQWVHTQYGAGMGDILGVTVDAKGYSYILGLYGEKATLAEQITLRGRARQNYYYAKFDNRGRLLWVQDFPKPDDSIKLFGLVVGGEETLYLVGRFGTPISLQSILGGHESLTPEGTSDLFIARIEPMDGFFRWIKTLSVRTQDAALEASQRTLQADANGRLFFAGDFRGSFYYQKKEIFSLTLSQEIFLLVISPDGELERAQRSTHSDSGETRIKALALSRTTGTLSLLCTLRGTITWGGKSHHAPRQTNLLIHSDLAGEERWSQRFVTSQKRFLNGQEVETGGIVSQLNLHGIAINEAGETAVFGEFRGFFSPFEKERADPWIYRAVDNSTEGFVMLFDPQGALRWQQRVYGAWDQRVEQAAFSRDGFLYLAGRFAAGVAYEEREIFRDPIPPALQIRQDGVMQTIYPYFIGHQFIFRLDPAQGGKLLDSKLLTAEIPRAWDVAHDIGKRIELRTYLRAIAQDHLGGIYFVGQFIGKARFDGQLRTAYGETSALDLSGRTFDGFFWKVSSAMSLRHLVP